MIRKRKRNKNVKDKEKERDGMKKGGWVFSNSKREKVQKQRDK